MSMIYTDLVYNLKMFYRNKVIIFWLIGFPIILFLLFGYLLGGAQGTYTLHYIDHDGSATSKTFLYALNATGAVQLVDGSDMDLAQQLKDGKIADYLEIPPGFGNAANAASPPDGSPGANVQVYYDKSKTESAAVISIVRQVSDGLNMQMSGARDYMGVDSRDVATSGMGFLQFLLPGIVGLTICSSGLSGTVATSAHNRTNGIFRKLATTPISRIKWNVSKIAYQAILILIAIVVILIVGWLVFGISPAINLMMIALLIAGSVAFSGLGLILASLIKDEMAVTSAANAAGFPLMFLSGSIFPVNQIPWFLQPIPVLSPLTYLNDGLRAAMVTGNNEVAMFNLLIVSAIALVLFAIGVVTLKWKED
jgi:ABC-2 type transport system permease protein